VEQDLVAEIGPSSFPADETTTVGLEQIVSLTGTSSEDEEIKTG
jgi:hypothetical protein